jgi:hypothetical protein
MNRFRTLAIVAGVVGLAVYLATTTGVVRGTDAVTRSLAFLIGPIAIVGIFRLLDVLGTSADARFLRICRVFFAAAFVLFTAMVVVQQTTQLQLASAQAGSTAEVAPGTFRLVRFGVNTVQLGLDVAFDIFYCCGMLLFAGFLYAQPGFGRVVGVLGMASAGGLLVLNLVAFPQPPSAAGLPDLGIATAVWWLVVIALQLRRTGLRPRSAAA